MRLYYSDRFVLPLPAGHRFPMEKYARLRERVEGAPWINGHALAEPPAADDAELATAHADDYVSRVSAGTLSAAEIRRIGFPWSPPMVERSRRSAGATVAACRAALDEGCGVNLAGGTHHAFRDRGEGYCVFNDAAVAAKLLQAEGNVGRVAVIDCDVHQGNGTAAIAAGDDALFTFSIHGAKNFPFHKEASDLDIELADGTGDREYLDALERGLAQTFARAAPQLVIYLAGADPFGGDRLGRLALSKAGLLERDRLVLEQCRRRNVPVAIAMAGGYARDIDDTVDIHYATVRLAAELA
ncbi:MAG TPA: histone deacetylase [Pelomicrobium sp.]|nr:histone deacetylase [Pelomicrobium sp.]